MRFIQTTATGEAAQVYKRLLATHPFNTEYELQTARLEVALKDYSAARQNLLPFLAADPKNREARLLLAQADLNQGRYRNSLEQFRILLRQDPGDFEAAFGAAQIAYYQDRLD